MHWCLYLRFFRAMASFKTIKKYSLAWALAVSYCNIFVLHCRRHRTLPHILAICIFSKKNPYTLHLEIKFGKYWEIQNSFFEKYRIYNSTNNSIALQYQERWQETCSTLRILRRRSFRWRWVHFSGWQSHELRTTTLFSSHYWSLLSLLYPGGHCHWWTV